MKEHTESFKAPEEELAGKPPFRRLFLDAMVTEESRGLTRVFHAVEKYGGNPVLSPEKPWEKQGVCVCGTVMWRGDKLTMRYNCYGESAAKSCYLESRDGFHWERPNLGLVEYDGSAENNITDGGTGSIIKVPNPKSARYQWAQYNYAGDGTARVIFSKDAINWHSDGAKSGLFKTSDVVNFFHDPYRERYVSTYKTPNRRHRAVGIALSRDGLEWYKPVEGPVFGADDLDPDATQVYGMPVFPYQGMYIGMPWIYHSRWMKYGKYDSPSKMYEAEKGSPCTVDVQFAWSWNLISWTRTPERKPFIGLGPKGSWESSQIYTPRNPVIMGDKLYFYYHAGDKLHGEPDVRVHSGLATLRLDGFCSMCAGNKEGWLISRREVFKTPEVIINAKTEGDGYVTAELVDRNNNVLTSFSREDCMPFRGDSVRHTLRWKTASFPAEMLEADKKIRFYIKNADLYSYLPADIDQEKDEGMIWKEQ